MSEKEKIIPIAERRVEFEEKEIRRNIGITNKDENLISEFQKRKLPYIIAYNKSDLNKPEIKSTSEICISAKTDRKSVV